METNSYDFSSKSCHGSILLVCGIVTCANNESSKSGAVSLCMRTVLKRQLRFMGNTIRPADAWLAAIASGNNENPASAAEPAFTKSLRFIWSVLERFASGPVFQKRRAIARTTRKPQPDTACTDHTDERA